MPSDRHWAVSSCRQAHAVRPTPLKGHCRQEPSRLPPGVLCYPRSLELVTQALERAGIDLTEYDTHSLRSSGTTAAADAHVAERLITASRRMEVCLIQELLHKRLLGGRLVSFPTVLQNV